MGKKKYFNSWKIFTDFKADVTMQIDELRKMNERKSVPVDIDKN